MSINYATANVFSCILNESDIVKIFSGPEKG